MNGTSTWNGDGYDSSDDSISENSSPNARLAIEPVNGGQQSNPYANDASQSYFVPNDPYADTSLLNPSPAPSTLAPSSSAVKSAGAASSGPTESASGQVQQAVATKSKSKNEADAVDQVAHKGSATMSDQLGSALSFDRPPLIEESIRWYQYPWRWMSEGWKNSAELGLDGSQGNAETLALQTGFELKRKTKIHTLALDFDYRLANTRDVVTEDNGRFNVDYDRLLGKSPWSLFGKFGMEWDEFKAFDLRLNLNSGLGYHWIRNDRTTLVTRFGAGASREIGAPIDDWVPEAVFGFDTEHQLNKRHKLKAKLDYFPSWEDFNDYRIVSDASWEILLSDDDSLSLKLAATDRYDSTPQGGNKPNDVYYSLLLLVKF